MDTSPLHIEKLVYGGDGLGHQHGKAVFVPFTAPGDKILHEPQEQKKRWCRSSLKSLLSESPFRISPECTCFTRCGGCQWQHIAYSQQVRWKHDIFASTLARHCGITEDVVGPLLPAPSCWNYRSRARLRIRWRKGGADVGFFQGRTHSVIPVKNCPVLDNRLNEVLEKCRRYLFAGPNAPARGARLMILEAGDSGGIRVILDAQRKTRVHANDSRKFRPDIRALTSACGAISFKFPVTFIVQDHSGMNVIAGDLEHPPAIHPMHRETMSLILPPGGFSQINLDQNRTLVSLVMQAAAERTCGSGRILDLYCGMGNFTLPLASMCDEIHGVDAARASINAAITNAASNRVGNCSFEAMPVETFVRSGGNLSSYDMILLDPPRSGAIQAVRAISRTAPASVIYVSCDPMTLARDLRILLAAGYITRWSRPVDLFPHTYHIESVTVLDHRG